MVADDGKVSYYKNDDPKEEAQGFFSITNALYHELLPHEVSGNENAFVISSHKQNNDTGTDRLYLLYASSKCERQRWMKCLAQHSPNTKGSFQRIDEGLDCGGDSSDDADTSTNTSIDLMRNRGVSIGGKNTQYGKVILEGYLIKQGFNVRTWKNRYFRLSHDRLRYFEQATDALPKGEINLIAGGHVSLENQAEYEFSASNNNYFSLTPHSLLPGAQRKYIFTTKDQHKLEIWLSALEKVCSGKTLIPKSSKFSRASTSSTKSHDEEKADRQKNHLDYHTYTYIREHSGWLKKRGGFYKSWKRRFFVLSKGILYYFKSESHATHQGMEKGYIPCGNVWMEGAVVKREQGDEFGSPFTFSIHPKGRKRKYIMVAAHLKQMNDWMDILTKAASSSLAMPSSSSSFTSGTERRHGGRINFFDKYSKFKKTNNTTRHFVDSDIDETLTDSYDESDDDSDTQERIEVNVNRTADSEGTSSSNKGKRDKAESLTEKLRQLSSKSQSQISGSSNPSTPIVNKTPRTASDNDATKQPDKLTPQEEQSDPYAVMEGWLRKETQQKNWRWSGREYTYRYFILLDDMLYYYGNKPKRLNLESDSHSSPSPFLPHVRSSAPSSSSSSTSSGPLSLPSSPLPSSSPSIIRAHQQYHNQHAKGCITLQGCQLFNRATPPPAHITNAHAAYSNRNTHNPNNSFNNTTASTSAHLASASTLLEDTPSFLTTNASSVFGSTETPYSRNNVFLSGSSTVTGATTDTGAADGSAGDSSTGHHNDHLDSKSVATSASMMSAQSQSYCTGTSTHTTSSVAIAPGTRHQYNNSNQFQSPFQELSHAQAQSVHAHTTTNINAVPASLSEADRRPSELDVRMFSAAANASSPPLPDVDSILYKVRTAHPPSSTASAQARARRKAELARGGDAPGGSSLTFTTTSASTVTTASPQTTPVDPSLASSSSSSSSSSAGSPSSISATAASSASNDKTTHSDVHTQLTSNTTDTAVTAATVEHEGKTESSNLGLDNLCIDIEGVLMDNMHRRRMSGRNRNQSPMCLDRDLPSEVEVCVPCEMIEEEENDEEEDEEGERIQELGTDARPAPGTSSDLDVNIKDNNGSKRDISDDNEGEDGKCDDDGDSVQGKTATNNNDTGSSSLLTLSLPSTQHSQLQLQLETVESQHTDVDVDIDVHADADADIHADGVGKKTHSLSICSSDSIGNISDTISESIGNISSSIGNCIGVGAGAGEESTESFSALTMTARSHMGVDSLLSTSSSFSSILQGDGANAQTNLHEKSDGKRNCDDNDTGANADIKAYATPHTCNNDDSIVTDPSVSYPFDLSPHRYHRNYTLMSTNYEVHCKWVSSISTQIRQSQDASKDPKNLRAGYICVYQLQQQGNKDNNAPFCGRSSSDGAGMSSSSTVSGSHTDKANVKVWERYYVTLDKFSILRAFDSFDHAQSHASSKEHKDDTLSQLRGGPGGGRGAGHGAGRGGVGFGMPLSPLHQADYDHGRSTQEQMFAGGPEGHRLPAHPPTAGRTTSERTHRGRTSTTGSFVLNRTLRSFSSPFTHLAAPFADKQEVAPFHEMSLIGAGIQMLPNSQYNRPFCFVISSSIEECEWVCAASDRDAMDEWIETIMTMPEPELPALMLANAGARRGRYDEGADDSDDSDADSIDSDFGVRVPR